MAESRPVTIRRVRRSVLVWACTGGDMVLSLDEAVNAVYLASNVLGPVTGAAKHFWKEHGRAARRVPGREA